MQMGDSGRMRISIFRETQWSNTKVPRRFDAEAKAGNIELYRVWKGCSLNTESLGRIKTSAGSLWMTFKGPKTKVKSRA